MASKGQKVRCFNNDWSKAQERIKTKKKAEKNKWTNRNQIPVAAVVKETNMLVTAKKRKKDCELKERAGAPVCPLLCSQKFDGGHFEWHWRVPPEWAAMRSERKEENKRAKRDEEASIFRENEEEGSPQTLDADLPCKSGQAPCFGAYTLKTCVTVPHVSISLLVIISPTTWLTVPGMCVLAVLWPLGPVVVVLLIFFFLRSSSRCSFCLFCTSINSEMKLFFTWKRQNFVLVFQTELYLYTHCS